MFDYYKIVMMVYCILLHGEEIIMIDWLIDWLGDLRVLRAYAKFWTRAQRKMKLTPELHYVLYFGLYILLP